MLRTTMRCTIPTPVVVGAAVLVWLALALIGPGIARAAPASPDPFTLRQPSGRSFEARAFGDEWSNGVETLDGYTIVRDPRTAAWEYAVERSGRLVPSGRVVGRAAPPNVRRHLRDDVPGVSGRRDVPPQAAGHNTGTQRTLVILASFADQSSVGTTATQWNGKVFGPAASVRDYYDEVSSGQLTIAPAQETHGTANDGIVGWVPLTSNHPNTGGNTGSANQLLTRNAIVAADQSVNFASFDTNGNGFISTNELHVIVIAAGYEASYGGGGCGKDVWGHNWSLNSGQRPTVDGVVLGHYNQGGGYSQFGEMHCDHMATIGIMTHELGHDLDWPDLYDTDLSSAGVGEWSVMSYGSWNALAGSEAGSTPPHPDAFLKSYQGWVTPTRITGSQAGVAIAEASSGGQAFQLLDNPGGVNWDFTNASGTGEYFLVENRQLSGYDAALPGCGLLVWHIDETVTASNAANSDETNKLVDLEEADGLAEIDDASSYGDPGDPFPGTSSNDTFGATSNPDSDLYSGAASGASIGNIGACAATMTADLAAPAGPTTQTLTVTKAGGGSGTVTSSPAGIACGATCQFAFPTGQQVTLTASASPGSTFAGWSGACSGTSTCTVTMNGARAVTATFSTSSGCPGSVSVGVTNFTYTPKAPNVPQGHCVSWSFNQGTHSVSETKLLGPGSSRLFDSGPKGVGTSFTYAFEAAGKYSYRSTVSGDPSTMQGTVKVPLVASATSGTTSTSITITWSHAVLSGYRYDVQYRHKPAGGSYSAWTNWQSNQTSLSAAFTGASLKGRGTYQFRGRLENSSTAKFSGWSASTTITIT